MSSAPGAACPSENELFSLVRGTLDGEPAERARAHVDQCLVCVELIACILHDSRTVASGPRARGLAALAPGTRVGRYRIREAVGSGAMGIVYVADDEELGRKVAVKMLRAPHEDAARRLRREAQAVARLSHPNVVVVHEVGIFEEHVFMAMEFVEGASLASWLGQKRALRDVLDVFVQAGRALAAAHAARLVHRDFKPDNVLVGRDGRVRVVDFGLARVDVDTVTDPPSKSVEGGEKTSSTHTGALVGTPAYMAPEQFKGQPADAATDQFAFCVTLYEAIHGVRPFEADSLQSLARAVTRGEVRWPAAAPGVPSQLERLLRRGLSVRPEDRYASMETLLDQLSSVQLSRGPSRTAAAIVIAVLGIGGFVALARETGHRAPAAPAPPSAPSPTTPSETSETSGARGSTNETGVADERASASTSGTERATAAPRTLAAQPTKLVVPEAAGSDPSAHDASVRDPLDRRR